MATLSTTMPTLLDHAKVFGPDRKVAKIVELLSQSNSSLQDMVMKEGNLPTGEQTTIRTGLPAVYWRLTNQGTPPSKSTTAQTVENAAMLVARCHADVDIATLNGDVSAYRAQKASAVMESMAQEMESTLFYGAATSPEEFVGFANRYTALTGEANSENVLDAGGTGTDNSSAWLIGWGMDTICGVYPKGSKAGISHEDIGIDDVDDADGNPFRAYKDEFKWKCGLVVKDWRYGVRIANIDNSELVAGTGTQATTAATNIVKMMSRAIDRIPNQNRCKLAFYVNRTVASHLRVQALSFSNSAIAIQPALNQFGNTIQQLTFLGVPVRLSDSLTSAEAQVT